MKKILSFIFVITCLSQVMPSYAQESVRSMLAVKQEVFVGDLKGQILNEENDASSMKAEDKKNLILVRSRRIAVLVGGFFAVAVALQLTGVLSAYFSLSDQNIIVFNLITSVICTTVFDFSSEYIKFGIKKYDFRRLYFEACAGLLIGGLFTYIQQWIEIHWPQPEIFTVLSFVRTALYGLIGLSGFAVYSTVKHFQQKILELSGGVNKKIVADLVILEAPMLIIKYALAAQFLAPRLMFVVLQAAGVLSLVIMIYAYNRGRPFLYVWDRCERIFRKNKDVPVGQESKNTQNEPAVLLSAIMVEGSKIQPVVADVSLEAYFYVAA